MTTEETNPHTLPDHDPEADPLRDKYVKGVEEAQHALDMAIKKLEAYNLLAEDIRETPRGLPRSLKEQEVEELARMMQGTFTHKDVIRVGGAKYNCFIDSTSVRTWLNRIAGREDSPLITVVTGKGPNPSVFRVKEGQGVSR